MLLRAEEMLEVDDLIDNVVCEYMHSIDYIKFQSDYEVSIRDFMITQIHYYVYDC